MIGINSYLAGIQSSLETVQSGVTSPFTNSQTFTSSGTWTRPAGVDWVYVILVGGGGGGGGKSYTCNSPNGSGGGSGSWFERWVQVTGNVSVVIGSGGGGGSGGNNGMGCFYGGNGGVTCFGSLIMASGGSGGLSSGQSITPAYCLGHGKGLSPGHYVNFSHCVTGGNTVLDTANYYNIPGIGG